MSKDKPQSSFYWSHGADVLLEEVFSRKRTNENKGTEQIASTSFTGEDQDPLGTKKWRFLPALDPIDRLKQSFWYNEKGILGFEMKMVLYSFAVPGTLAFAISLFRKRSLLKKDGIRLMALPRTERLATVKDALKMAFKETAFVGLNNSASLSLILGVSSYTNLFHMGYVPATEAFAGFLFNSLGFLPRFRYAIVRAALAALLAGSLHLYLYFAFNRYLNDDFYQEIRQLYYFKHAYALPLGKTLELFGKDLNEVALELDEKDKISERRPAEEELSGSSEEELLKRLERVRMEKEKARKRLEQIVELRKVVDLNEDEVD